MKFKLLIEGKTLTEIEAIGENWYARLNRLKEKYGQPFDGIENAKARKLIFELIRRTRVLLTYIVTASQPVPKYPEGGYPNSGVAIIGENDAEILKRF